MSKFDLPELFGPNRKPFDLPSATAGDESPLLGIEIGGLVSGSSHEKVSLTDLPSEILPFISLPFSLRRESGEFYQDPVRSL